MSRNYPIPMSGTRWSLVSECGECVREPFSSGNPNWISGSGQSWVLILPSFLIPVESFLILGALGIENGAPTAVFPFPSSSYLGWMNLNQTSPGSSYRTRTSVSTIHSIGQAKFLDLSSPITSRALVKLVKFWSELIILSCTHEVLINLWVISRKTFFILANSQESEGLGDMMSDSYDVSSWV